MSKDHKKFTVEVEVNDDVYSAIEEYSNHINDDEKNVIQDLVNLTLQDFERKYNNLKTGYVEMGKMNLEISNAFTVSENEAYGHILKD